MQITQAVVYFEDFRERRDGRGAHAPVQMAEELRGGGLPRELGGAREREYLTRVAYRLHTDQAFSASITSGVACWPSRNEKAAKQEWLDMT